MSPNKRKAMLFLSDKMEATAEMVGHAVDPQAASPRRLGAALLGFLREHDLVMRLPELNAWRLTKAGREWVSRSIDEKSRAHEV